MKPELKALWLAQVGGGTAAERVYPLVEAEQAQATVVDAAAPSESSATRPTVEFFSVSKRPRAQSSAPVRTQSGSGQPAKRAPIVLPPKPVEEEVVKIQDRVVEAIGVFVSWMAPGQAVDWRRAESAAALLNAIATGEPAAMSEEPVIAEWIWESGASRLSPAGDTLAVLVAFGDLVSGDLGAANWPTRDALIEAEACAEPIVTASFTIPMICPICGYDWDANGRYTPCDCGGFGDF